ncbi:ATP-binding protein [Candidatus Viridilinea mediisalina]|uniref:histidine kinase n=1 Tax=Candidatus Viridilinea mediisalina TaxID=2024553 RepID=A0A2A6RL52_9CHLR|nr:ATP-binding protein [Candidatus Viridilinea mediisalina]PDW03772.1 hypothetical protein CJ255_06865 [Candidatus Viridilinea mediisalina]
MQRLFPQAFVPAEADDPLVAWRQRTTQWLVRFMLLLLPFFGLDLLHNLALERWVIVINRVVSIAIILGLAFTPKLDYRFQSWVIVLLMLTSGIVGVINFGLFGATTLITVVSMILALLLLGARAALLVGLLFALSQAIIFASFALGLMAYPYGSILRATEGMRLLNNWFIHISISATLALLVASMVKSFQASLAANRKAYLELQQVNANLDATVDQRTAELREAVALLKATQCVAQVGGFTYVSSQQQIVCTEELYRIHEVPIGTVVDVALIEQLYPGQAWTDLRVSFEALETQGTAFELELPARTLTGRSIWVRMSGAALKIGEHVRCIGTVQDITPHKHAAEELAHARDAAEAGARAKAEFLATMSHELRTPLNAIIGMTELLQDTQLDEEQQLYANTISSGGKALLALINDILDLSRIDAGRLELEEVHFELPSFLASLIHLVAHQAHQKHLALHWSYDPDLPQWVTGDEHRLRQILLNLLTNALKFTNQGEVLLHASAGVEAGTIQFHVRDTGIGISPEQQQRIFAPFEQADSSTARRYGGSGLGLAISHKLATLMGGQLTLQSEVNLGSSFTLTLPLPHTIAHELEAPQPAELLPQAPLRILVAEDNPVNQILILRILEHLDHQVTIVENGSAALKAVQAQPYDLVLMDIQMPEMDGLTATRQIRALGNQIQQPRIIALTANAFAHDRQQALAAGMDDFLSKPLQPQTLWQALQRQNFKPTEPASNPTPDVINWAMFEATITTMSQQGSKLIATMLQIFEHELPERITLIETLLATNDRAQLQREAHRLHGAALQLGAQALAVLCAQIEHAAPDLDLAPLVGQLRPCLEASQAALRERGVGD